MPGPPVYFIRAAGPAISFSKSGLKSTGFFHLLRDEGSSDEECPTLAVKRSWIPFATMGLVRG